MSDQQPVGSELSRELSLFHVTMMGLGMMIGAGVFIGIGNTLAMAGPGGLMLTFALNGLLALLTAASFAELSSAIPRAGGAYNFARLAFGRQTSFLAGWMEWFASSVAGSLYAVVFATYTLEFFFQMGWLGWLPGAAGADAVPTVAIRMVALTVAVAFVYVNYRGSSETGKVGAFFTLGQMIFVLSIAVLGAAVAVRNPERVANFEPFMPHGWSKLLVTMGFIYVAFEGFEVIAQAGDETIDPKKNIPKAMLYSVLIVTFTYIAVSFATVVSVDVSDPELGGLPAAEWIGSFKDTGFGRAVAKLMPSPFWGYLIVTLSVIFSSTSALNATIYSATRASYALGRDRMLPAGFARISKRYRTPWVALLATAVIVVVVATLLPTKDVASSASIMFIFLFFLVNLCVIRIRRHMGDELDYGYVMPFFPLLPIGALVCQAVLAVWLVHMSLVAWIVAPVWIGSGLLIYHVYSKRHAVETEADIRVFEEEQAPEGDQYRVMAAIANPDNALSMIRHTYALCAAKQARVELIHMVPVPAQVPLSDAERYMTAGREAIGETMLYLAPMFPFSSTIRYCRNVARGIVSAVREKRTDLLIMGWHGGASHRHFRLGSTIDPILERVPCSVVVFKDCGDRKFKRVLVPVAGGPNSAYALEIASILARAGEGSVVAFTVAQPGREVFDVEAFVEENRERIVLPPERVKIRSVVARRVTEGILSEVDDEETGYDLLVMGGTLDPLIYKFAREAVPEVVAKRCRKPMVMVKASGGIRSWINRWI